MTSCNESYLSVYTDYLSHENLASYYIKTPDPLTNNPPIGQRLIIMWMMPQEYRSTTDLQLQITIRFRNHEETIRTIDLPGLKGTYVYELLNDDYIKHRGFLCYKIDLISADGIIEEWRHKMWTDFIILDEELNHE